MADENGTTAITQVGIDTGTATSLEKIRKFLGIGYDEPENIADVIGILVANFIDRECGSMGEGYIEACIQAKDYVEQ
jgi:hypothetical protein